MKMSWLFFSLAIVLGVASARAEVFVWKPASQRLPFVLFQPDGHSRRKAVVNYVSQFNNSPDLRRLQGGELNLPIGKTEALPATGPSKVRVLILANDASDMSAKPEWLERFSSSLVAVGAEVLVVPVAATIGLSDDQIRQFGKELGAAADVVLAIGGDDIAPELTGRKNIASKNTNLTRDTHEARLLKSVLDSSKASVVGVCRGHQLILSILDDRYELQQELDMPEHRDAFHKIDVLKSNTLLDSIFFQLQDARVRSIHHQGFRNLPADGPAEVIATGDHGVVEAAILKNERGFGVQFHPEVMNEAVRLAFARAVVHLALKSKNKNGFIPPGLCSTLFTAGG